MKPSTQLTPAPTSTTVQDHDLSSVPLGLAKALTTSEREELEKCARDLRNQALGFRQCATRARVNRELGVAENLEVLDERYMRWSELVHKAINCGGGN